MLCETVCVYLCLFIVLIFVADLPLILCLGVGGLLIDP
jgi:hypothetical protein